MNQIVEKRPPIIIPCYQPGEGVGPLVDELIEAGFSKIFVVDDGSTADKESIFTSLEKRPQVTLLRHVVNLGKGAALKMAMNQALLNHPDAIGVITVDGDGQHTVGDVKKLAGEMIEKPNSLILGARGFDKEVPFRSRIGNLATKWIFKFLVG